MDLLAPIAMLVCLSACFASVPAGIAAIVVLRGRAEVQTREVWRRVSAELGLDCTIHGFDDVHLTGVLDGRAIDVRCVAAMNRRGVMRLQTRVALALADRPSRSPAALERLRAESAELAGFGGGLGARLAPAAHDGARIEGRELVVSVPRVWREAEPLLAFLRRVQRLADALDAD